MKVKLTEDWRHYKAGDLVQGNDAAAALKERAAELEGRKPVERAEKRPAPGPERR